MRRFITGNHAVAEAVRLCRPQVVAAYPITPQTPIYEKLSEWEADGLLGGIMMRVESEHSAMAACLSASLAGARTFTATSSQGLALMHEMLHFAAGCRTGVVMVCVNRTMAAPWAFWSDQTDSLSQRDTGWLQYYCEDNQEALDTVIQAFRVAEEVLLPVMVAVEGNFISHFMEPVEVPDQEQVDDFLPPPALPRRFDVENPGFVVPVVNQKQYQEYRRLAQEAMEQALSVVESVDQEFHRVFGRGYGLVEAVECGDADLILVTTATITSTARSALRDLRGEGIRVGLVKLRSFRPFPTRALRTLLDRARRIAVVEIKYMGGPETIPNREQVEACRKGLVDMVFTTVGYYTSIMPVVDGLNATKLTPWEERAQGVNDFLNTLHQEKVNSYYLGRLGTGIPFMLYLTKPIDKADLKGFKIRVSPTNIGFVKAMGGQPVVIPPPEVYTALERGVVNGVIWPAGLIRDWGWHEVIEYLVEPGFYSAINVVLVNMDAWEKLPADLKELLIRTEEEAERWAVARGRDHVASEMEKFVEEGIQVIRLPDAETQKMLEAANETLWKDVISKAPESGPKLRELISR